MLDNDEKIIVLAQRVRAAKNSIITDTLIEKDFKIEGKHVNAILNVIQNCHLLTVRESRKKLREYSMLTNAEAQMLLELLSDIHLITTNRLLPRDVEIIANNPSALPLAPRTAEDALKIFLPAHEPKATTSSHLEKILAKRKSVREFTPTQVQTKDVRALMQVVSGIRNGHHSVPSAGAIYSCVTSFLMRRGDAYEVFHAENSTRLKSGHEKATKVIPTNRLNTMFIEQMPFKKQPLILAISANYELATKKYGARGWRFAILEAGHLAQNIHLRAIELGLQTCEFGGFKESETQKILGLGDEYLPLILIIAGYQSESIMHTSTSTFDDIRSSYLGATKIVPHLKVYERDTSLFPDKYFASAQAALPIRHRGYGRSVAIVGGEADNKELAIIKAIAEGVERFASGWITKPTVKECLKDLEPRDVLHPNVLQRFLEKPPSTKKRFSKKTVANWYTVRKWKTKQTALTPGDFLFYPYGNDGEKLLAQASSNGVAAHTDFTTALWKGTAELLERESLLAWWFSGFRPPRVPTQQTLPLERYKASWKRHNIEMHFLNITTSIPTVCAIGLNHKEQGTYIGTASATTLEEAAHHACSELTRSITWAEESGRRVVLPQDCILVSDHLHCFASGYAFPFARWWSGEKNEAVRKNNYPCSQRPQDWLSWVVENVGDVWYYHHKLPTNLFGSQPLTVVRSIIPGVTTIKFGYKEQDLGLPRMKMLRELCSEGSKNQGHSVPEIHPLA